MNQITIESHDSLKVTLCMLSMIMSSLMICTCNSVILSLLYTILVVVDYIIILLD